MIFQYRTVGTYLLVPTVPTVRYREEHWEFSEPLSMSELPKPSPSAAVTVNYATEFCVERLPRKTVGCFVVTVFQVADNKGNTIHVKRGRNYYGK